MHLALYAPGFGYYVSGTQKFGEGGDFITAPEVSPLFGDVLAAQCAAVADRLGQAIEIVEYGGGSGRLAASILQRLAQLERLPTYYTLIEVSAELRARQRACVEQACPELAGRLRFVDAPQPESVRGVIIANEVMDALPCERFRIGESAVLQAVVIESDEGLTIDWCEAPPALAEEVEQLQAALGERLPVGYVSELTPSLDGWLRTVSDSLVQGVILLADYGADRHTLYAAERLAGTFLCHYRQHAHEDAMWLPGGQDLTAWVDFSRAIEALDAAGLCYLGYTTQSQFLLSGGLFEALQARAADAQPALSRGVKTLTLPGEMGERFKFLGVHKHCDVRLPGFSGRDFGHQL